MAHLLPLVQVSQVPPPHPPSVGDSSLEAAFLTCEASIDLVVAGPQPEDSTVGTRHAVHGGSSHLLEVVSAVSAAEEETHIAPNGLEDLLGLGYRGEEVPFTGALWTACSSGSMLFPPQGHQGCLCTGALHPAYLNRPPRLPAHLSIF